MQLARAAVVLAAVDAAVKGGSDGEGLDPVQKQLAIERAVVGIASSRRPGRRLRPRARRSRRRPTG